MSVITIKKYDYVDALRGIAILLVIIVHTSQWVIPTNELLRSIFGNGDKGVQLFYVISALTLCFSLEARRLKESKYILYFYLRRFFRIAPLFYLAIVFYNYPFDLHGNYYAPNGIKVWYILSTITFTHGWHPETINSVVPGGWSIAVEFTFYLLLPLLFYIINNKEKAILLLIFSCFLSSIVSPLLYNYWAGFYQQNNLYLAWGVMNYGFFYQFPVFCVGIILYHFLKEEKMKRTKFTMPVIVILALYIMYAYMGYIHNKELLSKLVVYAIAFSLLTYTLAKQNFKLFVNPVTIFIGKLSYSMYLIHFAIIGLFEKYEFWGLSKYGSYGTLVAIVLVVISAVAISFFTYHIIEKNGIKLGDTLIKKIEKNSAKKNVEVSI